MLTKEILLSNWIDKKKEEAVQNGEPTFQDISESWFENSLWCCQNGHITQSYLKSEIIGGAVCLKCGEFVKIFPKNSTIEEFKNAIELKEVTEESKYTESKGE